MAWSKRAAFAAAGVIALCDAAEAQQPAAQQTVAQPPEAAAPATTAVQKFEPAFFARYNPVTALDMVRQVPGFIIDDVIGLRGFGATAGNVLIDGKRPASKLSLQDELGRISAKDVLRVELIGAAAAGDIDVRGYTELANVVLKPATQTQVTNTWSSMLMYQQDAQTSERIGGTRQWKTKDFGFRLNAQISQIGQRNETAVDQFDALDVLIGTRREFVQQELSELLLNSTLNWTPSPRDSVNITDRIMARGFTQQSGVTARNPSGTPTQYQADDYTEKDILYLDLGGDWEHKFSPTSSVKVIVVNSFLGWRPQEYFQQYPGTGPRSLATRINTDNKRGEHVLRGVWTVKTGETNTVEMGGEVAFNYRDIDRSAANAVGTGPFVPQFLPVASTHVEELRGEAFVNDTWRIDPKLTLEAGFTFEASRITQTGDANQEREFTYPKPRFVATWLPDGKDQFRFSAERTVGQLDFSQFASTIQLIQNTLTAGNPDLKPAQTWDASLQWKRPLGQRGSISLTGFYDWIDDVLDFVVIQNGASTFTGIGNIGKGTRYGGSLEFAYPLDQFGVKGGMLKFTTNGRHSEVTDPISNEKRLIVGDYTFNANVDFRQDIPEWKLAWGGDYTFPGGESKQFRLNEIQTATFGPGDLDLFVETTKFKGMTWRLALDNIADPPNQLDRRFFTPSRLPGGVYSSSEFRRSHAGYQATLSVQGTF